MRTVLAPAVRCAAALALSVKRPVHSRTMSTPSAFHGSSAGSLMASTSIALPSMVTAFSVWPILAALISRWIESYRSRCASVLESVRSLMATSSRSLTPRSIIARTMQRPILPKPLIAILVAIGVLLVIGEGCGGV